MIPTGDKNDTTRLIVVTGPTASGKTRFAAMLAKRLEGEIISADSRQVYRGMDIGTGKDLADYNIDGFRVPYHLIDIIDPGDPYNVYRFQQDFLAVYEQISAAKKMPILCGGSGLYIEAVLKGYRLIEVPPDESFREAAGQRSDEELIRELSGLQELHNTSDIDNRKRLIRALEIARYYRDHPQADRSYPVLREKIIGIRYPRNMERQNITRRLKERLENGMIAEVQHLTKIYGWERMEYFGLEYKLVSLYLRKELTYNEMFQKLNTAIHQFAKRQMTWFRRMERNGIPIFWIAGEKPMEEKLQSALNYLGNLQ